MAKKETKKGNNTKTTTTKKAPAKKTTTTKKAPAKKATTTKKAPVKKAEPKKEVKKVEVKEEVKEVKKVETKKEEVKKVEVKETKKSILTKKNIIIASSILVAIIILFIVIFCFTNKKAKITKSMKNMGKDFYTEYYYKELSKNRTKKQLTDILSRFKDKGIKISLKNMSIYNSGKYKKEIESFKSNKQKCDLNKSKVVIYPKAPYGKTDYKVDVILDCGF